MSGGVSARRKWRLLADAAPVIVSPQAWCHVSHRRGNKAKSTYLEELRGDAHNFHYQWPANHTWSTRWKGVLNVACAVSALGPCQPS